MRPLWLVRLARTEWPIRLRPTRSLCLLSCRCCTHSPSQNVPQSSRKWRDILEYITINFKVWFAGSFWTKNSKRFCAINTVMIAEPIWAWSKRLGIIIAGSFWTKNSKRFLGVAWLAALLAGCKKHSTSLIVAFVIAVVIAVIWVIVAVIVAVVAGKAWGAVTSFKLEWWSLSACSPVDAVVIGTESCLKCAGLSCGWESYSIVEAGLSFGTGGCTTGLSFESCKKLEVEIAGPLSGTESCSIVEAGPSFVFDVKGFVEKLAWLFRSISFARCFPLESFWKISLLLHCESNAFPNVLSMRKIVISISRVRNMFIK